LPLGDTWAKDCAGDGQGGRKELGELEVHFALAKIEGPYLADILHPFGWQFVLVLKLAAGSHWVASPLLCALCVSLFLSSLATGHFC
jgi:hypothetical protein